MCNFLLQIQCIHLSVSMTDEPGNRPESREVTAAGCRGCAGVTGSGCPSRPQALLHDQGGHRPGRISKDQVYTVNLKRDTNTEPSQLSGENSRQDSRRDTKCPQRGCWEHTRQPQSQPREKGFKKTSPQCSYHCAQRPGFHHRTHSRGSCGPSGSPVPGPL